ncbi:hypothetical protein FS837_011063 [Tulasnella sp. UAMH 9824]|nr:hypothetical protein FS837_011063 [Tulasnella sp. UAMH 9824]
MTLEDTCASIQLPATLATLRASVGPDDNSDALLISPLDATPLLQTVLWTSICKALGKSKADITRMIESDPELQQPNKLRRVKGGFLRVQGTWIPHSNAMALARKIAWEIKDDLVPFFGPEFPSTCLAPNDPGFADILAPRTRARRSNTTTVAPGPQPSPSGNSPSQMQGQSWLPSSPPAVQRQNSAPVKMMNNYPPGYTSPSQGNRSPSSHGSPHTQPAHGYPAGAQPGHQGRYNSASGTASPGQTITEEPYGTEGIYTDAPGQYAPTGGYPQYTVTYTNSSAPGYGPAPSTTVYFQHQSQHQSQPQYPQPPYGVQPYSTQATTPVQPSYPSTDYNYASRGVSAGPPQPCNTYQEHPDQNRPTGYASSGYPTTQQPAGYQEQYQHPPPAYPPYANESSARYETGYSNDPAQSAYGNEGGSSRGDYGYTYANGSPGVQGQPAQPAYQQQQPIQYSGAEYREQRAPSQQQSWGAYPGY